MFSVIKNPVGIEDASTYKFAVSGHTVGALTNDILTRRIAGRVGAPPTHDPASAP